MAADSFLVIDAGSGSVKSFLISPVGEVLARSERDWDRDNWNSEEAWLQIADSISELTRGTETRVLGVSSTSMREEFILLEEDGKEIPFKLCDESEKHGYKVLEEHGEAMYISSGHWPVPNWIAGAILPWLSEANPRLFDRVSYVLMISDWVNFRLSSVAGVEGSGACETSLFSIRDYDWDWSIIDQVNLPRGIFPKVLRNGTELGSVTKQSSNETGIPEGVPVILGGADTQCGLLGMGTLSGEAGAVGGTTTPVQIVTEKPVFDDEMRTWTNNYLVEDSWILESNVGYTGRGIRWLRDEFGDGIRGYEDLTNVAKKVPLGCNGVLAFLGPHVFDCGPPYWPMDKLGNLPIEPTVTGSHSFSVSVLSRAIFEANCYGVRANLDQLREISGLEFDYLHFCGGNSKSDLWMQIQADVLDMPVHVPLIHDASAVGTAILASIGSGYYGSVDEAVECMVKTGRVYKPRRDCVEEYQTHYDRWMRTRERLGRIE
ncbi:MAG: FGGY-family carbohydrate kinase [Candidatus Bathyarchaeota archaeon]|nr:FGGY-family carbohydrate kinase [Candidatus Bathyarchaeota archaeon]